MGDALRDREERLRGLRAYEARLVGTLEALGDNGAIEATLRNVRAQAAALEATIPVRRTEPKAPSKKAKKKAAAKARKAKAKTKTKPAPAAEE